MCMLHDAHDQCFDRVSWVSGKGILLLQISEAFYENLWSPGKTHRDRGKKVRKTDHSIECVFVINKQLEKSAINVKEVLRRLYSYALHPSSFKRLGSALGFNHIYTVLRSVVSLSSFAVDEDIRSDVHF